MFAAIICAALFCKTGASTYRVGFQHPVFGKNGDRWTITANAAKGIVDAHRSPQAAAKMGYQFALAEAERDRCQAYRNHLSATDNLKVEVDKEVIAKLKVKVDEQQAIMDACDAKIANAKAKFEEIGGSEVHSFSVDDVLGLDFTLEALPTVPKKA